MELTNPEIERMCEYIKERIDPAMLDKKYLIRVVYPGPSPPTRPWLKPNIVVSEQNFSMREILNCDIYEKVVVNMTKTFGKPPSYLFITNFVGGIHRSWGKLMRDPEYLAKTFAKKVRI